MEDFAGLMRRLFRGEVIFGHDGPAGKFPLLHLDATLDEHLPMSIVAFGPNTLELGGRCFDEVVLHTYFTDETTARCVRTRQARGREGRAAIPPSVRVWSCFATVGDHLPEDQRLMKTVGRLGTYLQGYGDLLVRTNGWDPAVLAAVPRRRRRAARSPVSTPSATTEQLEHVATLHPRRMARAERRPARPSSASPRCATSSRSAATA